MRGLQESMESAKHETLCKAKLVAAMLRKCGVTELRVGLWGRVFEEKRAMPTMWGEIDAKTLAWPYIHHTPAWVLRPPSPSKYQPTDKH